MRERTAAAAQTGNEDFSASGSGPERAAAEPAEAATAARQSAHPQIAGTQDFEFVFSTDVIYHRARQAFLSGAHRWTMFGVILAGASAATAYAPGLCGLIASALGAADIAFDFTGRAQAHGDAARKYLALIARFSDSEPEDALRKAWLEISAEEPATYRLAYLAAHNETVAALGRGDAVALTFGQRLRRHFWPH